MRVLLPQIKGSWLKLACWPALKIKSYPTQKNCSYWMMLHFPSEVSLCSVLEHGSLEAKGSSAYILSRFLPTSTALFVWLLCFFSYMHCMSCSKLPWVALIINQSGMSKNPKIITITAPGGAKQVTWYIALQAIVGQGVTASVEIWILWGDWENKFLHTVSLLRFYYPHWNHPCCIL